MAPPVSFIVLIAFGRPVLTLSGIERILKGEGIVATQPPRIERRTEKLDLRISPSAKARLQAAASAARRPISEFVLESALLQADATLADRSSFALDAQRWKDFMAALDAPPRRLPRLEALLHEPAYFDPPSQPGRRR